MLEGNLGTWRPASPGGLLLQAGLAGLAALLLLSLPIVVSSVQLSSMQIALLVSGSALVVLGTARTIAQARYRRDYLSRSLELSNQIDEFRRLTLEPLSIFGDAASSMVEEWNRGDRRNMHRSLQRFAYERSDPRGRVLALLSAARQDEEQERELASWRAADRSWSVALYILEPHEAGLLHVLRSCRERSSEFRLQVSRDLDEGLLAGALGVGPGGFGGSRESGESTLRRLSPDLGLELVRELARLSLELQRHDQVEDQDSRWLAPLSHTALLYAALEDGVQRRILDAVAVRNALRASGAEPFAVRVQEAAQALHAASPSEQIRRVSRGDALAAL